MIVVVNSDLNEVAKLMIRIRGGRSILKFSFASFRPYFLASFLV